MGNALVMFTTPTEAVGARRRASDPPGTPPDHWLAGRKRKSERTAEEPDAYYDVLPVPPVTDCVWAPPAEPWKTHGLDWHQDPQVRREHLHAVQESLETFLNRHLARLNGMVRTGWFVLGKLRVRVVECRPVPERVLAGPATTEPTHVSLADLHARGVPRSTVRGWLRQGLLEKTRKVGVFRATAEARRRLTRYSASIGR